MDIKYKNEWLLKSKTNNWFFSFSFNDWIFFTLNLKKWLKWIPLTRDQRNLARCIYYMCWWLSDFDLKKVEVNKHWNYKLVTFTIYEEGSCKGYYKISKIYFKNKIVFERKIWINNSYWYQSWQYCNIFSKWRDFKPLLKFERKYFI